MVAECSFKLNGKPMSSLECKGFGPSAAFSGYGKYVNDPKATFMENYGALPTGVYYIVTRPLGGRLGGVWETLNDWKSWTKHADWFALYKDDGEIDDHTVITGDYTIWVEPQPYDGGEIPGHYKTVKNPRRGSFRLHPEGLLGISEGCITLPDKTRFYQLRDFLLHQPAAVIPGTEIRYYGKVTVE